MLGKIKQRLTRGKGITTPVLPKQDFNEYAWQTSENDVMGNRVYHYFAVWRLANAYKQATQQDMIGTKVVIEKVSMPIDGGFLT